MKKKHSSGNEAEVLDNGISESVAEKRGSPVNSYRLNEMHQRHRLAMKMSSSKINQVHEKVWTVASSKNPDFRYVVR